MHITAKAQYTGSYAICPDGKQNEYITMCPFANVSKVTQRSLKTIVPAMGKVNKTGFASQAHDSTAVQTGQRIV